MSKGSSNLAGAAFTLGAAALFGASAPLAKLLLARSGPLLLAAFLYLGAALALYSIKTIGSLSGASHEARLQRGDWWPLIGTVTLGGMLGPFLMLFGLQRISALAASLLLNFEAPFTAALAVWLFHEHLGRRGAIRGARDRGGSDATRMAAGHVSRRLDRRDRSHRGVRMLGLR
jgi:drug/metabolite transporter (DMT)-like permease